LHFIIAKKFVYNFDALNHTRYIRSQSFETTFVTCFLTKPDTGYHLAYQPAIAYGMPIGVNFLARTPLYKVQGFPVSDPPPSLFVRC